MYLEAVVLIGVVLVVLVLRTLFIGKRLKQEQDKRAIYEISNVGGYVGRFNYSLYPSGSIRLSIYDQFLVIAYPWPKLLNWSEIKEANKTPDGFVKIKHTSDSIPEQIKVECDSTKVISLINSHLKR
jgi:hypothetical protein